VLELALERMPEPLADDEPAKTEAVTVKPEPAGDAAAGEVLKH